MLKPEGAEITWTEDSVERNNRFITEFLNKKIAESGKKRSGWWNRDFTNHGDYQRSVEKNRERFCFITGVRDDRIPFEAPERCETLETSALFGETETHNIYAIRWPVFDELNGEGLLLEPKDGKPVKTIIHIPHAGVTPEQLIGLEADALNSFFNWPQSGERMIIPAIIDRNNEKRRQATMTNREFIYRTAYQMGRHIIGYEVQEILALVDWIKKEPGSLVQVTGHGDGGLLAFYAAAADTRIDEALVVDYFENRDRLCEEPIDRNVFALLQQFGDAEIASLIAPRKLVIAQYDAPEIELTGGCTPGRLTKQNPDTVRAEIERAKKLIEPLAGVRGFEYLESITQNKKEKVTVTGAIPDGKARVKRLMHGMEKHTQRLLDISVLTRREFWNKLDESSPGRIAETIEWYRDYFAKNIVGVFDDPFVDPNPRIRLEREDEKYTVYEVELDVFDGLTAYGMLLIPNDMVEGEKRPVVVCQHGLETSARRHIWGYDTPGDTAFTSELCARGYITFSPQGIFCLGDRFRFNQRQLNPLGKDLFAIMTAQHQQITTWLETLPFVEKGRIGLYGASYGGTTVMMITPLIPNYTLGICSANFNYWNYKLATTLLDLGYTWDHQYEVYEFDMGNTFDHSDMARLIAPRPFMVERGHLDGVSWDEYVGFEFGKVRYFYDHCLKIPERAEIHWADGGHKPFGTKAYPFIDKFLKGI